MNHIDTAFAADQRLLNWGARRAAFRPYYAPLKADFPWYSGLFRPSLVPLSYKGTIKNGGFLINGSLMKSTVYYTE